jgi:hypothetical protein
MSKSEDKAKQPQPAQPKCPNKSSCALILAMVEGKEYTICLNCNKTIK